MKRYYKAVIEITDNESGITKIVYRYCNSLYGVEKSLEDLLCPLYIRFICSGALTVKGRLYHLKKNNEYTKTFRYL